MIKNFGGGMKKILIWTNSSPTSSFANQTIASTFSGYEYLMYVFRISTTDSTAQTIIAPYGGKFSPFIYLNSIIYVRSMWGAGSDGLFIGDCNAISNGTATVADTYLIPIYIYGLKGNIS